MGPRLTVTERAKLVLELCAFELKHLSIDSQITLQYAIEGQINDALREQSAEFNKTIINKSRMQESNNNKLQSKLKIREKKN